MQDLKHSQEDLEACFFGARGSAELASLRSQMAGECSREALQRASGVSDPGVLDALLTLGLGSDTVAALGLAPLVWVAWADDRIQVEERELILDVAERKGIAPSSAAYKLLAYWLGQKPAPELFGAWKAYVQALARDVLTPQQLDSLGDQISGFAHEVAEAAGGFLGVHRVSAGEKALLQEIVAAFARPGAPAA
jgi:hypothetical protein